ncbi:MAG: TonB-dependent receptor [Chitinophagaceae bacterium]|nr:TonB-dependent receptor [Chitinophagaceae bacterium]
MRKLFNSLLTLSAVLITLSVSAQKGNTVTGNVKTAKSGEAISAVSVTIKGGTAGAFTDDKGRFVFTTNQKPPFTLVVSSIGFGTKEVVFNGTSVSVELTAVETLGQEIVVSATRTQERILESPVSIERMSAADIRNSLAPNYYDAIANFKGVDMTTSSLNFRTISTRGFNGSGNLRFNQLVDGMDNQAPGLNFSVGSIVGPTQLDVDNVELLQGASSAIYGSGGMTGTLLMTSKNPFKYQGLSFQVKAGVNHIDESQTAASPFHNWDVRWAKKVSDKFAFKIGAELTKGNDWQANDFRNLSRNNVFSSLKGGTRASDPNYDGVNVFGDEASASMHAFAQVVRSLVGATPAGQGFIAVVDNSIAAGATPQMIAAGTPAPFQQYLPFLIPTSTVGTNPYRNTFIGSTPEGGFVSRTGYEERDLVDYNNYNVKLNGALHYKLTNSIEASLQANYGVGTTVYTGADRYSIKNLAIGQYKFELKHKDWFLRAYTTQENSGDAYTATTAAVAINSAWKGNQDWFTQYTGTFGAAYLGLAPGLPASNNAVAHGAARTVAETGRFLPGSQQFRDAFNKAVSTPISKGGAKFDDKTSLYHYEGQYNFSRLVKAVDILVGASYRNYSLNSNGTIFADTMGPISVYEYGGYIQLQKKFLDDKMKITVSGRYDKSQNFDGRFTPRATLTYKVAENNYIRASYQQAYRFPSLQDQWINLKTPSSILIGGLPNFNTRYNFSGNPAYTAESIVAFRNSIAAGTPNVALLKAATFTTLKPEVSNTFELGYRGVLNSKLLVDAYVYYSQFENFIGRTAVGRGQSTNPLIAIQMLASPFATDNYSFVSNASTTLKSFGWGISTEYKVYKNYLLTANVSGDQLNDAPKGLVTFYNTPKLRYNIGLSNPNVCGNWGFGANYRWQDAFLWEGTFGTGDVPAYGAVDAFISYKFTSIKSLFKFGATNLMNKYYRSAFGNPQIGGMYYASFGFNVF